VKEGEHGTYEVNGKMKLVETIPGMGWGVKDNDGG
jgi:hypothetical protein